MPERDSIFLVGPMGVGKSSIGRKLALRLGREFVDCDEELIRRTGVEIDVIFEIEGEEGFRARESRLLAELVQQDGIILATGGGVVLKPENRELLRTHGTVVFLHAPAELLARRMARDRKRPLLQTPDRLGRIRDLMESREPLYREVCDVVVETDRGSVAQSVESICRKLQLPSRS